MFFLESMTISGVKSPEELSNWMKSNIRYHNFTKLMSAEEVFEKKYGSCHDQVMFELKELRTLGVKPKALFVIEYNPDNNKGGTTHSFVYYNKGNKVCWFENAWGGHQGIHEYNSLKEIKDDFIAMQDSGKFGNVKRYPLLEFTSFGTHEPGETLQEFVSKM